MSFYSNEIMLAGAQTPNAFVMFMCQEMRENVSRYASSFETLQSSGCLPAAQGRRYRNETLP